MSGKCSGKCQVKWTTKWKGNTREILRSYSFILTMCLEFNVMSAQL